MNLFLPTAVPGPSQGIYAGCSILAASPFPLSTHCCPRAAAKQCRIAADSRALLRPVRLYAVFLSAAFSS